MSDNTITTIDADADADAGADIGAGDSGSKIAYLDEYRKRREQIAADATPDDIKPSQEELEKALDQLDDLLADADWVRNWVTKRVAWHRRRQASDPQVARAQALLAEIDYSAGGGNADIDVEDTEHSRFVALLMNLEVKDLLDYLLIDGAAIRSDTRLPFEDSPNE